MPKIIIELKVTEIVDEVKDNYRVISEHKVEENRIKLEVESYEKAETKVAAFFKMLDI